MTKSMGITKVFPCFGVLLTMTDDTLSPLSIFCNLYIFKMANNRN